MTNEDEDYIWSVALPPLGLVVTQRDYSNALCIVTEMRKMGVPVALLREPKPEGPYEQVHVHFVGYEDD